MTDQDRILELEAKVERLSVILEELLSWVAKLKAEHDAIPPAVEKFKSKEWAKPTTWPKV